MPKAKRKEPQETAKERKEWKRLLKEADDAFMKMIEDSEKKLLDKQED